MTTQFRNKCTCNIAYVEQDGGNNYEIESIKVLQNITKYDIKNFTTT